MEAWWNMRWENVIWKWMAALWLLAVSLSTAAEIVAWKVPLTRFAVHGMDSEGLVRLNVPPEASPFFGAGDELWDLSALLEDQRIDTNTPLDWAVWNSTTSTLVTKSDWNGVWRLRNQLQVFEQATQCRVTLKVFEVPKDGSDLSEQATPVGVLSCVTRSGLEAEAETRHDATWMRAKMTATVSDFGDVLDLRLDCSNLVSSQPRLDLKTDLVLRPGRSVWVARDFDGTRGLDINVSASVELADGSPFSDAVRIQMGNRWRSVVRRRQDFEVHRIAYDEWLGIFHAADECVNRYGSPSVEDLDPSDPFDGRPVVLKLPDSVKPWIANPVWDLRGRVLNDGIELNPSEWAGVDPLTLKMFFLTNSPGKLDLIEKRYNPNGHRFTGMVAATIQSKGQIRMVSHAHGKPVMSRSLNGQTVRRFEIEPSLRENDDSGIGLRYVLHDQSDPGKPLDLDATSKLTPGRWLELRVEDDATRRLRAKAEMIPLD